MFLKFPIFVMMIFDSFKYDLRSIPIGKVFDKYPDLYQLYAETLAVVNSDKSPHDGLTAEQVVCLVVYAYHHTSPLVRQYASMHIRRKEALKLLSFTLENAEDLVKQEGILPYIIGANKFVNHLAIQFCKFEPNSHKWIELCRKQDMLDDVFLALKGDLDGNEKKTAAEILTIKMKLEQQAEGLQIRINQLASEIFSGDTELTPLAAAHSILEKRKPIISPARAVGAKKAKLEA